MLAIHALQHVGGIVGGHQRMVRNVPLPPSTETKRMWYRLNITELGEDYAFLDYQWKTSTGYDMTCPPNPNCTFCCGNSMEIFTRSQVIGNGSDDSAPQIGGQIAPIPMPMPSTPGNISSHFRPTVPNIDLDCDTYYPVGDSRSTDMNACASAAVANGLQWLVGQHSEIEDTTSLRTKLDTLKSYMNLARADLNGVRFDSAVIGQLTLIDALQLPVRVSYQTILESGNTEAPLQSSDTTYEHIAYNDGDSGLYPTFQWFREEMLAGAAVEVLVGWYGTPNGSGERARLGGHWLVSSGYYLSDSLLGIWLQNDVDQCEPGGLCHEYYVWDTLVGNIPFLPGLTDADGNIGIVEAIVSGRYDPTVTFGGCVPIVTSTDDSGAGSLRDILSCMSSGDTLFIDPGLAGDTIYLTSSPLTINKNITISADPNLNIYIKGESIPRVFNVLQGTTVTIQGLYIICGNADTASCIQNAGTVILRDAILYDHDGIPGTETQIVNTGVMIIEGGVELKWE
jgi:hypothetical protein